MLFKNLMKLFKKSSKRNTTIFRLWPILITFVFILHIAKWFKNLFLIYSKLTYKKIQNNSKIILINFKEKTKRIFKKLTKIFGKINVRGHYFCQNSLEIFTLVHFTMACWAYSMIHKFVWITRRLCFFPMVVDVPQACLWQALKKGIRKVPLFSKDDLRIGWSIKESKFNLKFFIIGCRLEKIILEEKIIHQR